MRGISEGNRLGIAGQLTVLIDTHEEIKMSKQKHEPDFTGTSNKKSSEEKLAAPQVWQPDGPTLGFKNLLKFLSIKRSKAYQLMKEDPTFPKGVPLYESRRSPKFFWTHEAMAWLEARSNKFRNEYEEIQP